MFIPLSMCLRRANVDIFCLPQLPFFTGRGSHWRDHQGFRAHPHAHSQSAHWGSNIDFFGGIIEWITVPRVVFLLCARTRDKLNLSKEVTICNYRSPSVGGGSRGIPTIQHPDFCLGHCSTSSYTLYVAGKLVITHSRYIIAPRPGWHHRLLLDTIVLPTSSAEPDI